MFKIREAVSGDYQQLLHLYQELHQFRAEEKPEYFLAVDVPLTEEEYEYLLNDPAMKLYVVEQAGELHGFTFFKEQKEKGSRIKRAYHYLEVEELYVKTDSRRKGVVQHLFERVKKHGRRQNLEEVRFKLWEFDEDTMDYYQERLKLVSESRELVFRL